MTVFSVLAASQCLTPGPAAPVADEDLEVYWVAGPTVDDESLDTTTSPEIMDAREYLVKMASAALELAEWKVNVSS